MLRLLRPTPIESTSSALSTTITSASSYTTLKYWLKSKRVRVVPGCLLISTSESGCTIKSCRVCVTLSTNTPPPARIAFALLRLMPSSFFITNSSSGISSRERNWVYFASTCGTLPAGVGRWLFLRIIFVVNKQAPVGLIRTGAYDFLLNFSFRRSGGNGRRYDSWWFPKASYLKNS